MTSREFSTGMFSPAADLLSKSLLPVYILFSLCFCLQPSRHHEPECGFVAHHDRIAANANLEKGTAPMTEALEKPYFTMQVSAASCRFDVRVNDIPMIRGEGPLTSEFPVNPWVFTGENELSVELHPPGSEPDFKESSSIELLLYQRPSGSPRKDRQLIDGIRFRAADAVGSLRAGFRTGRLTGEDKLKISKLQKGALRATLKLDLKTPFPRWAWLDAQVIKDTPSLKKELLSEYERFWNALKKKDIRAVVEMTDKKATEIAAAYYLKNTEAGHEKIELKRWVSSKEVYLADLVVEDLDLEVIGNGRLAQLVDADKDSPLVFVENDNTLAHYISGIYCRPSSGKWLQIR